MATLLWTVPEAAGTTLSVQFVILDANYNETVTNSSTITEHPVEDGSNISDHVIDEPEEIQLECLFTQTPTNPIDILDASDTQAEEQYDQLLALRASRDLVTVFTNVRVYENRIITKIVRVRNSRIGEDIQFTMTLREVRKVKSEVVDVPTDRDEKQAKKKRGKVNKEAVNEATDRSMLNKLLVAG